MTVGNVAVPLAEDVLRVRSSLAQRIVFSGDSGSVAGSRRPALEALDGIERFRAQVGWAKTALLTDCICSDRGWEKSRLLLPTLR